MQPGKAHGDLRAREQIVAVFQRSVMPYRRSFLRQVALRLGAEGVRVVVFSADKPSSVDSRAGPWAPRYVGLGSLYRRSIQARDISEDLVVPRGLLKALWREKPDVIVTEDISGLPANLCVPLLKAIRRTPYLIWTLGPSILGKRRSWWRGMAAPAIALLRKPADGFIAYSHWAGEQLERTFGKPVYVAPNSTVSLQSVRDLAKLRSRETEAPLRVIFIGRLTRQKRVDRLIDAMAILGDCVEADIVGDGSERQVLEAMADRCGVAGCVRFHGDIRDEAAKNRLIDASDVGVMPGLGGLFIQEVQSRGCAVLAGPADGTEQDLVRRANPGLYLEQGTVAELAEKLAKLHADPAYLATCRKAARKAVIEDYNLENMVESWVSAVMATLGKSRAGQ